ncbi:GntR family transcriptional regulator [Paeniglutamicibacter gangotriensis]|uniref:GntR family transcriptional regulator n=2 Tax=Paeniglutamicibacter gangotriensis TaxID=254787 RepID=M7MVA7_9MICC|nr:GntR family transcriptional regulator [Paeniglutamicibacter gangotriensis]EMR00373.1 GntR family transcriptional regulator [Paeniglutamicibacter gangotriensis Lz1y]
MANTVPMGTTQAEHAYLELRERIIDMRLPPGSALDEEALMRDLAVGRTPMREAVKRLESDRMLKVFPRRGTIIADVNIRDLKDISDARRVLEAFAARRAAEQATDEDRDMLRACLADIEAQSFASNRVSVDLDGQMHRAVYAVMRNSYVESTLIQYFYLSQRMWNFVLSGLEPIQSHVNEHTALLRAIIDGDPELAARLAEEHITHFENRVREAL